MRNHNQNQNQNQNEKERNSMTSSPVDCEVGLGLKMQLHSYSSCDGGGGGVPFFNASTNQPPHPHVYEHANGVLAHRTLDNAASRPYAYGYGIGGMNMMGGSGMYGGKGSVFTSSQLQELERQKMIHKYILANIPVPPQLLLSQQPHHPSHSSYSSSSSLSQCNTRTGVDMRYGNGNGSDPEPWRCKRTDGKKWRCSRDVAGDQKYCERHAHKNRPRSRKHVEPVLSNSPHKSSSSTITTTPPPQLQRSSPSSQFPYDQTRCIEWLMRGGIGIDNGNNNNNDNTNPLSLSNNNNNNKQQQWEQMMQISPPSKNYDDNHVSAVYHPQFAEKQADAPYMDSDTTRATTRLFIDSWGKDATKGLSVDKKTSLSLSMSSRVGELGDHDDEERGDLGIGMMIGMNHHHHQQQQQWLNPISWINSLSSSSSSGGGGAPGGPLGEALCLGNGGMNFASSPQNHTTQHGCCYATSSNSNTNSSKSSCQDASHALNFIG